MPRILPISDVSYESWLGLWLDYTAGEIPIESELHALTFRRLCDGRDLHGVVAVDDQPIGFAHYYFHPSTWAISSPCYIQDLYVSTRARGRGIGRRLVDEVCGRARRAGSPVAHWNTRSGNDAAHALYDRIAERSDRVIYVRPL